MLLPLSWVNDYVKVDDIDAGLLAEKLVNIGFEVESVQKYGADIRNVVVGKILAVETHYAAARLKVCMVDVGEGKPLKIVTGASNVKAGDSVPVAKEGAELPGGKQIGTAEFDGIISEGMLCSGGELGITDAVLSGAEINGILLLPAYFTVGRDIVEALGLGDVVFDVSVTANRPDCCSIYGMSREIAALLKRKLRPLKLNYRAAAYAGERMPTVEIADSGFCQRYTGSLIKNVRIGPSPAWMRRRLEAVGVRPVNNLVDITNFVLFEVGQPLHAFDIACVEGALKVRPAACGEEIEALNGESYKLDGKTRVIADDVKPLAIAGVMGGAESGVTAATKTVFLETARFNKGGVRTAANSLGLRSDSSAKYERGVDNFSFETGRLRALTLVEALKCGIPVDITAEAGCSTPPPKIIETQFSAVNGVLGIEIPAREIVSVLTRLGFGVTRRGDKLTCTVPPYREDVDNFTDLAEEAIRFYGYDKLAASFMPFASVTRGGPTPRLRRIDGIKRLLTAAGLYETISFSFVGEKAYCRLGLDSGRAIRLQNPLSEEYALMRTQLVGSMLDAAYLNLSRKNDEFRLFEIASVYLPQSLPLRGPAEERQTLCVCLCGGGENFFKLKGIAETLTRRFKIRCETVPGKAVWLHPGISADLTLEGRVLASLGRLHPAVAVRYGIKRDIYIMEMNLELLLSAPSMPVKYSPLSKFPPVSRDLALTVNEEVKAEQLLNAAKNSSPLILEINIFDIYRGERVGAGKKSVAFSMLLQSYSHTLTDKEINDVVYNAVAAAKSAFGAELRS